ncbi:MAG: SDR family NAD(P)-dependent oxidoreductase [Armatimonadaceae bacterium]
MELNGKVALVTGAGSGIGKAAAKRFAAVGASVVALTHEEEEARQVVEEITAAGGKAFPVVADISQEDLVKDAYNRTEREYGRLDVVFANAGINGVWAPLEELTLEEWNTTITVNLTGTFVTIKYAVPLLKRQGGSVIVTSSVNGSRIFSNTGATAYSCSKAGQVAMTKMLAVELGPMKIRVNVICPGAIETEIGENTEQRHLDRVKIPVEYPKGSIPLTGGKSGSSEQVADLALFLASDASSHISGTEIWIDGAQSLLEG